MPRLARVVPALLFFECASLAAAGTALATGAILPAEASPRVSASPRPLYRLDEPAQEAKPSYYSSRILKFLDRWPPPTLSLPHEGPVIFRAIRTPGHDDVIGMVKHFTVNAPLERVVQVTEDFESYPKIWDGVLGVTVLSRDGNRTVTDWTRKRPAFFLPQIRYRMLYVSDKSVPGRVVYRQQLIDGNALNSSDAVVVLERLSEGATRVSVVDFIDANLGLLRAVANGAIWKRSLEDSFKDDISFISHLEHPEWAPERVAQEAERALDQHPVVAVEYTDRLKFD